MTNELHDEILGVTFTIPHQEPLDSATLQLLVDRWKQDQRNQLFVQFKSAPGQEQWSGDEAATKEELLRRHCKPGTKIVIQDVESTPSNLENHPPLTPEAKS